MTIDLDAATDGVGDIFTLRIDKVNFGGQVRSEGEEDLAVGGRHGVHGGGGFKHGAGDLLGAVADGFGTDGGEGFGGFAAGG